MKIGHFVPVVSRLRGYERNVSGHIQIPLMTAQLLAEAGHDIHLITNEFDPEQRVLPWCMPQSATVHYVRDSRRRLGSLEKKRPQAKGVYPIAFLRQVQEMKQIAAECGLELLHLSGHPRTVQFGAILKQLGLRIPTVSTLFDIQPKKTGMLSRFLMRRSGTILTATEFVAHQCSAIGVKTRVLRHGLVRDFRCEMDDGARDRPKTRVLFWRDPTENNGADVAMAVAKNLAPKFRHLTFDFAVRPQRVEVAGLDELGRKHANINVYRFPYPEGVSLANLLAESLVVLLPFRQLTIHPQLAIAETLAAGVPVVTSNLGSTNEVVLHGKTGMIVPIADVDATIRSVEELISNPDRARRMGHDAEADIAQRWSWTGYIESLERIYESEQSAM